MSVADPDLELSGVGVGLLALLAFLPSVVSSFLLPNIRGAWVPPLDPPLHETRLTPKKHFTQKKTAYTHPQEKKPNS